MEVDFDELKGPSGFDKLDLEAISIDMREDQHTIEKMQSICMPEIPEATQPISGIVTPANDVDIIRGQLEEIGQILKDNPPTNEPNYLIRVRVLVAQMLEQLNKISQKDREQMNEMKKQFKEATSQSAQLTRDHGWSLLKFSVLSFAASFTALIPNEVDREIIGSLAKDVAPKIGDVFATGIQSSIKKADGIASLVLQEYSAKANKSSSDASNKQEIIRALDEVLQSLKSAARSA